MFSDSNTKVSEDCTVTHPTEDGLRSDVTKSPSLNFFYPLVGLSHEREPSLRQQSYLDRRDKEGRNVVPDPQDDHTVEHKIPEGHPPD